jgi:hypothetical protein
VVLYRSSGPAPNPNLVPPACVVSRLGYDDWSMLMWGRPISCWDWGWPTLVGTLTRQPEVYAKPKSRQPCSPEFRRQLAYPVHAGRDPAELAREFEPTRHSIRGWLAKARQQLSPHEVVLCGAQPDE